MGIVEELEVCCWLCFGHVGLVLHTVLHLQNGLPVDNRYRLVHIISNSALSRNSALRLSDLLGGLTYPRVMNISVKLLTFHRGIRNQNYKSLHSDPNPIIEVSDYVYSRGMWTCYTTLEFESLSDIVHGPVGHRRRWPCRCCYLWRRYRSNSWRYWRSTVTTARRFIIWWLLLRSWVGYSVWSLLLVGVGIQSSSVGRRSRVLHLIIVEVGSKLPE